MARRLTNLLSLDRQRSHPSLNNGSNIANLPLRPFPQARAWKPWAGRL